MLQEFKSLLFRGLLLSITLLPQVFKVSRTSTFHHRNKIIYFHRLKFKNISLPSFLPLISHWTDKDVSKRIKEEVSTNHFGNGIILSTYPISESMVFESSQAVGVKVNHIDIGHPSLNEEPFRDQPPQNEEHDEKIEFQ